LPPNEFGGGRAKIVFSKLAAPLYRGYDDAARSQATACSAIGPGSPEKETRSMKTRIQIVPAPRAFRFGPNRP
jgi:hypothetical protein